MTKHKRQHYIPSSYLEAWRDPNTPSRQTSYVWRISKDGGQANKKAPRNLLHETDMYSIFTPEGNRDLHLESNLSRVESEFAKLRAHKLRQNQPLTSNELLVLCMFTAAMFARTKAYGKYQSSQWQRILDMTESLQSALDAASQEERNRVAAVLSYAPTDEENSISLDEVRELVDKPIQSTLSATVVEATPLLCAKPFLILETSASLGFITSDNPCVWYDPAIYQKPRPFGAGGLISPTLEITLPLSPNQILFFGGRLIASGLHVQVDDGMVDQLNKRTWLSADEFIVSSCSTVKASWR